MAKLTSVIPTFAMLLLLKLLHTYICQYATTVLLSNLLWAKTSINREVTITPIKINCDNLAI